MSSKKLISKFVAEFLLISTSVPYFNTYSCAMESKDEEFQKGMYKYLKNKLSEFLKNKQVTGVLNGQNLRSSFVVNRSFKEKFIDYLKKVPNMNNYTGENSTGEYYKASAPQYLCDHQSPLELLQQLMDDTGYRQSMPCSII